MLEVGTFLNVLRDCSFVFPLWRQVVKYSGEWVRKPLPESPWLCLLRDRSLLPPGISKQKFGLQWQDLLVLQGLFFAIGRVIQSLLLFLIVK